MSNKIYITLLAFIGAILYGAMALELFPAHPFYNLDYNDLYQIVLASVLGLYPLFALGMFYSKQMSQKRWYLASASAVGTMVIVTLWFLSAVTQDDFTRGKLYILNYMLPQFATGTLLTPLLVVAASLSPRQHENTRKAGYYFASLLGAAVVFTFVVTVASIEALIIPLFGFYTITALCGLTAIGCAVFYGAQSREVSEK